MVNRRALAIFQRSTEQAHAVAEYLESHAKRAYGAGPEAEVAAAKSILGHTFATMISKTDFQRGTFSEEN
jgi:hypothetical protein